MKRILIVEDDSGVARVLRDNLVHEGFAVDCVDDGFKALEEIKRINPDLVLLDLMIPGLDGFEVCRALEAGKSRVSVIMLTARTQHEDKIRGLQTGADDYITKPFVFGELLARIHAVLRRRRQPVPTLTIGSVIVDFDQRRASNGGTVLPMTAREFALLQHLAEHAGQIVSREELLRAVWGYHQAPVTRTVDNFVARLRRKIEPDPHHPRFIHTVHGDGYTLTPDQ